MCTERYYFSCADGYLETMTDTSDNLISISMALLSSLFFAIFMVLIKPIIAVYRALRITAISLSIGAIGLWLIVGAVFGIWLLQIELLLCLMLRLVPF